MKGKRRLILLALVCAFLAGATLVAVNLPYHFVQQGMQATLSDTDKVQRVDVSNPVGAFSLVQLSRGKWQVQCEEQNLEYPADRERVEAFLQVLRVAREASQGLSSRPAQPTRTGEERQATVTVNGSMAFSVQISPTQVLVDTGQGASLLPQWRGEAFLRDMNWFRDLHLLRFDVDSVKHVAVSPLAGDFWEAEAKDGGYVFLAPEKLENRAVLEDRLELFLHRLTLLQGKVEETLGTSLSTVPDLRVELETFRGNRLGLDIFLQEDQDPVVKSSQQEERLGLDRSAFYQLDLNAFSLVDRRLVPFAPGKITTVSISHGKRRLHVERAAKGWKDKNGFLDRPGIDMLLWKLTSLQYEYGPVELPGTAVSAVRVVLHNTQDATQFELEFFRDPKLPKGQCWVHPSPGEASFPVDEKLMNELESFLPAEDGGSEAL